jgi:hypothetical protein
MEITPHTRLIYQVASRQAKPASKYEAIEMHVRGLREDRLPVPKSHSFAEYVALA